MTKAEVNLVARAVRERWPTNPRVKDALLTKVARVGLRSEQPRVVFAAFRAYAMAERQNQLDEHRAQPEVVVHAHVGAEARAAVADLSVEELRTLRRLRSRMLGGAVGGQGDEADAGMESGEEGLDGEVEQDRRERK